MCQRLSEVAWATEPLYEFPPPPSALTLNSFNTFEGSVESTLPPAAAERKHRVRLRQEGLAQEGAHYVAREAARAAWRRGANRQRRQQSSNGLADPLAGSAVGPQLAGPSNLAQASTSEAPNAAEGAQHTERSNETVTPGQADHQSAEQQVPAQGSTPPTEQAEAAPVTASTVSPSEEPVTVVSALTRRRSVHGSRANIRGRHSGASESPADWTRASKEPIRTISTQILVTRGRLHHLRLARFLPDRFGSSHSIPCRSKRPHWTSSSGLQISLRSSISGVQPRHNPRTDTSRDDATSRRLPDPAG